MKNHMFLVYNISYKSLIDSKPLRIRFDKIDEFIRVYNWTRYLVLFGSEKYGSIYSRVRYLIGVKCGIMKVDTYNFSPQEKTLTLRNVIILVKSVWNKDKNNYYFNIFLEKASKITSKIIFCIKYKFCIMTELTFDKNWYQ